MNGFWPSIVTIATAIVGLAVVAVLMSPKAQTSQVINAGGSAFSGAISAATNPYSGGGSNAGTYSFGDLTSALSALSPMHI